LVWALGFKKRIDVLETCAQAHRTLCLTHPLSLNLQMDWMDMGMHKIWVRYWVWGRLVGGCISSITDSCQVGGIMLRILSSAVAVKTRLAWSRSSGTCMQKSLSCGFSVRQSILIDLRLVRHCAIRSPIGLDFDFERMREKSWMERRSCLLHPFRFQLS